MSKYEYLKKFIDNKEEHPRNSFYPITIEEIQEVENRLGFELPLPLKEFWLEIGYGFFRISITGERSYDSNRLATPNEIADILLLGEDSPSIVILPYVAEYGFEDGEIPFFEIATSSFLVMKPKSDYPDAVYDRTNEMIEEHFERFIWRLYHESPDYYLGPPIIEKKKPTQEELLQGTPPRGKLWEYVNHNYHKKFREDGVYEKFWKGGEPAAEEIRKLYSEIKVNRCSCGNVKMTPKARQCLKCGVFSDPILE